MEEILASASASVPELLAEVRAWTGGQTNLVASWHAQTKLNGELACFLSDLKKWVEVRFREDQQLLGWVLVIEGAAPQLLDISRGELQLLAASMPHKPLDAQVLRRLNLAEDEKKQEAWRAWQKRTHPLALKSRMAALSAATKLLVKQGQLPVGSDFHAL
jgi:hypothetical protein